VIGLAHDHLTCSRIAKSKIHQIDTSPSHRKIHLLCPIICAHCVGDDLGDVDSLDDVVLHH
jgi:hypothetical protein